MNISDEKISAFLDAELEPEEMERMRQKIAEDESVATRVERLAANDALLRQGYKTIDEQPLPESLQAILAAAAVGSSKKDQADDDVPRSEPSSASEAQPPSNVVVFPVWRRAQKWVQQHTAVAACAILAVGYTLGIGTVPSGSNTSATGEGSRWANIVEVLDQRTSGTAVKIDNGAAVLPQLSFLNQRGDYCRQYTLSSMNESSSVNIACRSSEGWQLQSMVTIPSVPVQGGEEYQTASSNKLLDAYIDQIIDGDALSRAYEEQAIKARWAK